MLLRYFTQGLTKKTLEDNIRFINNYICNSNKITDGDKRFIRYALSHFFYQKREYILRVFHKAKTSRKDYIKIVRATKFASQFISEFINSQSLGKRVFRFLVELYHKLDVSEERLLKAYETKTCPICGHKFGRKWKIQSCGALMVLKEYKYGCPNGH